MTTTRVTFGRARKLLPRRKKDAHKAQSGRALIIAGSKKMPGAAVLSACAAARVGAGYVTLAIDRDAFNSVANPDFLLADPAAPKFSNFDAIAIGPGLGTAPAARRLVRKTLRNTGAKMVIDADALNICAKEKFSSFAPAWIITPHEAELARLLGTNSSAVKNNREKFARLAQKKFGCIVVLKGYRTLIAAPGELFVNTSGNRALAKAGTGDVLTGMIAGFLAQGVAPLAAAQLATFLHGHIADRWIKSGLDYLGLIASDLLREIPRAIARLRRA